MSEATVPETIVPEAGSAEAVEARWALDLPALLHEARALQTAPNASAPPLVLVVGVSGGVDSVVLLHLLAASAPQHELALHVAHFDHALRATSAEDAHFVAQVAADLGLPFHTMRGVVNTHGIGLEAAARRARYQWLSEVARRVTPAGATSLLAVAHHADDQAETVLLNLVRGTGTRGLRGMRRLAPLPEQAEGVGAWLLRPLLQVRRVDLLAWAQARNLTWREDETNVCADRPRTILRHKVIPELLRINPNARAVLHAAATRDAVVQDAQAEIAALLYRAALVEALPGARVVLTLPALVEQSVERRMLALEHALRTVFAAENVHRLALREVIATALRADMPAGGPYAIAGNVVWTVLGASTDAPARLSIHHKDALPISPPAPWLNETWRAQTGALPLPALLVAGEWALVAEILPLQGASQIHAPCVATPWEAWLDADRAGAPVLTTVQAGMRIAPLGMGGRRRLLGDILTDSKIPTALRPGWPLVQDGVSGRVLWLCGLTVSEDAALTASTARALHLCWRRVAPATNKQDALPGDTWRAIEENRS